MNGATGIPLFCVSLNDLGRRGSFPFRTIRPVEVAHLAGEKPVCRGIRRALTAKV